LTRAQTLRFLGVAAIWGFTWTVIRGQLGVVPAPWSVAWRFTAAAAVMAAYVAIARKAAALGPRGHLFAAAVGLFQFALNFNLVYAAEGHVTSGLVAVMFALLVVPNALLGWIFLRHRIPTGFAIGALLGIVGVLLMFKDELTGPALDRNAGLGLGMTALAVLCASVANVMQASGFAKQLPVEPLLATALAYGAAMDIGFAWATAGPPAIGTDRLYLGGLAYLALGATVAAFLLYYGLIRLIGPARAGYANLIVPFVAMALSTLFEGYIWTRWAVAGGMLAACGLVLALRNRA